MPDKWESSAYDGGIESTSPDGAIYVALEMVKANDVKSATQEGSNFRRGGRHRRGFDEDAGDEDQRPRRLRSAVHRQGQERSGHYQLTLVGTNAQGKFLMVYYWGSEAGEKANADALGAIASSVQATK